MEAEMSMTILTVDDSNSVRQMVRFTLNKAGYDVIEASDGRDAITKSHSRPVDMVITDLHMPHMDGIELIRNMRSTRQTRYVPIIMLTTETQQDKKTQGKTAGATGWIVKPFTPEQLLSVVRKVLG